MIFWRKNEYYWANVNFEKKDVRGYKFENCSLVTSIFTLQFMPRKDRFDVLQNIYNGLNHGGAFIFAEKTVCEDSRLQEMITFNFYDYKRKHFEASDILEKEKTFTETTIFFEILRPEASDIVKVIK